VKRLLFTSALVFVCATVFAQQNSSHLSRQQLKKIKRYQVTRNEQPGGSVYGHEFDVGGRLNTNGWSAYLEYEKRSSEVASTMFQLEFGEIKDPKENKTARQSNYYGFGYSGHAYVYGKENIFYQAKLGMGQRRIIGGKGNKNGVEVSAVYLGGLSLGLVKPYYLQLTDSSAGGSSYQKYSPSNANDFLNPNNIVGGPGLGKGWSEVKVVPGLYARLGMRFDWAEFNEFVSALEVGVDAEYYGKKVQIMVENPARQFFYGAYVSLVFGKRW
jgi:hypothetical protein